MDLIYSEVLEETADSVEAVPGQDYFTCGTYQLLERNNEMSCKKMWITNFV